MIGDDWLMGELTNGVVRNWTDHKFMSTQQLYDHKQPRKVQKKHSNNDKGNSRAKSTLKTETRKKSSKNKQRRRVRRSALDPSADGPATQGTTEIHYRNRDADQHLPHELMSVLVV